jgi:hypothetical protein
MGVCTLNYHQYGLPHFHPHPNPPPSRGGDATNSFPLAGGRLGWGSDGANIHQTHSLLLHSPSPLVGLAVTCPLAGLVTCLVASPEGWGEGLQTISLRSIFDVQNSTPLPDPLPQGARGLDCSCAYNLRGNI